MKPWRRELWEPSGRGALNWEVEQMKVEGKRQSLAVPHSCKSWGSEKNVGPVREGSHTLNLGGRAVVWVLQSTIPHCFCLPGEVFSQLRLTQAEERH